jgi:hypothetical protein
MQDLTGERSLIHAGITLSLMRGVREYCKRVNNLQSIRANTTQSAQFRLLGQLLRG